MGIVTPLGLLNFLVLQWFGVRLARESGDLLGSFDAFRVGDGVYTTTSDGVRTRWRIAAKHSPDSVRLERWKLLRWIWPLTGWWSDYRWIARRK